jgi:hypothetical protein
MRGDFRYLRFKNFSMTPKTPQCEVFWALLLSSEHSGVPEDSKSPTFPSVGLHPHTWPKWGCDIHHLQTHQARVPTYILENVPLSGDTRSHVMVSVDLIRS